VELVGGFLQAYDWGPVDGLTQWTTVTGAPQAELWFGTHANGRSPLLDGSGSATADLPILAKILAAARPLSIQIHPPAAQARALYDRQRADPTSQRLVADPFGKAEMLIALEPFVILEGFRDHGLSATAFALLGPALAPVAAALREGDLAGAVMASLGLPPTAVRAHAERLPDAFAQAGLDTCSVQTIAEVVTCFPSDPGVFVAALLNARVLQPGQGVYVDPGTVHAYVRGLGIEVMANSDNVLRLGLTSKTIAVQAALSAVDLAAQPHPCDPAVRDGVRTYASDHAPFTVQSLIDADIVAAAGQARIVLCLQGMVHVDEAVLHPGQGALLEAGEADATVVARGRAVVARHANPSALRQG
jgi:mannose-6-phosphate isomerase